MDSKEIAKHAGMQIRRLRKEAGLTQGQLAKEVGVTISAISGYESGYRMPRENFLYAICEYFKVSLNIFYPRIETSNQQLKKEATLTKITKTVTELTPPRQEKVLDCAEKQLEEQNKDTYDTEMAIDMIDEEGNTTNSTIPFKPQMGKVSLIPSTASAGLGDYMLDDIEFEEIEIPEDDIPCGTEYAIKVSGDSMIPEYPDGSIALFKSAINIEVGEIGIFQHDNELFIKEAGRQGLISHNDKYKVIKVNPDDPFRIIGKVLGVYVQ